MAFSVTPTSGDAPYVLTANIANSALIDGVKYAVSVAYSSSSGSCPAEGSEVYLTPIQIDTLLTTGSFTSYSAVNTGNCRTFTLEIIRVLDSVVVDSSSVSVDNV